MCITILQKCNVKVTQVKGNLFWPICAWKGKETGTKRLKESGKQTCIHNTILHEYLSKRLHII